MTHWDPIKQAHVPDWQAPPKEEPAKETVKAPEVEAQPAK